MNIGQYGWKKLALAAVGVVLICGVGIGVGVRLAHPGQGDAQTLTDQLGFTPLVKQLPAGYAIDPKSIDRQDAAVAYVAKNASGNQIVISQQVKPSDQKIQSFVSQNVQKTQTIGNTRYASVMGDGPLGGKIMSIMAGDTWLMLSTPNTSASEDLIYIAQHL